MDIQRHILFHGPVATNVVAPKYFKYYKMGVLTSDSTADAKIDDKLIQLGLIDSDEDDDNSPLERRITAEANLAENTEE